MSSNIAGMKVLNYIKFDRMFVLSKAFVPNKVH